MKDFEVTFKDLKWAKCDPKCGHDLPIRAGYAVTATDWEKAGDIALKQLLEDVGHELEDSTTKVFDMDWGD